MQKDAKLVELESKPIARLLTQYSLPAIVGMAAMSVYNLVDAMYIGQCCGPYAIAAMALAFPITNLMVAVGAMVGLGCSSLASISLGQQDFNRAFRILGHCLVISILSGILIGWFPLVSLEPLLSMFGITGQTMAPAYDFMLVLMLGFPVTATFMNLNHLMRASGYPKQAMVSLLISLVVNIGCAHLFIFVLDWGMTGAGLAIIAAQAVGLIWVLAHFFSRRSVIHFCKGIYKISGPILRRICMVGLPPCMLNACGCLVVVAYNYALQNCEGDMGAGAFGIINRVIFFFVMITMGITQGMQPIAGYNLGMGNYGRVKRVLFYAMLAATGITTIGWLLMEFFPRELVLLFVDGESTDAEAQRLIEISTNGTRIMALAFPIIGSQIVIGNFFQAIGRPVMSIFLNMTRQFIFLIPCLLILPHHFGTNGVWFSQVLADVLSAVLGFIVIYLFITRILVKKTYHTPIHDSDTDSHRHA